MFEKLKNRSEWKAYVVSAIVYLVAIGAHIFFDVELDEQTMNILWMNTASVVGYAGSRGLAKIGSKKTTIVNNGSADDDGG